MSEGTDKLGHIVVGKAMKPHPQLALRLVSKVVQVAVDGHHVGGIR